MFSAGGTLISVSAVPHRGEANTENRKHLDSKTEVTDRTIMELARLTYCNNALSWH